MAGDRWEVVESSLGRSFARTRPQVRAAWKKLGSCLQSLGQGCTHRQEFLRPAGMGTGEGEGGRAVAEDSVHHCIPTEHPALGSPVE